MRQRRHLENTRVKKERARDFLIVTRCLARLVNWLQSCKLSKLENDPIVRELNLGRTCVARGGPAGRIVFKPPTLTACNFDASHPIETHNTSLERSQPPLHTELQFRGLAGFLIQNMLCQSNLIYIGLML